MHAGEHQVRVLAQGICDQQLLGQAEGEDGDAQGDLVGVQPVGRIVRELRHHLRVMQHRSGDQMREIGDEEQVVHEAALVHLALPAVDQEGDLGEGVEGDADRQRDVEQGQLRDAGGGQSVVDIADEEVRILEDGQHAQIDHQRQHQQALAGGVGVAVAGC
ncbi:hypothetical protein L963_1499 [Leuconostoc mesenteroides subsp. cremoris T26]|nr:hypothetical protein L963_1499 [Leuconostoc mesenteroides subsp. cremoris T26]